MFALLRDGYHEKITYNLIVKVINDSVADYEPKLKRKLAKICNDILKVEKPQRNERLELNPLDVTPSFQLKVTLSHDPQRDLNEEF